jgi:galactokinase
MMIDCRSLSFEPVRLPDDALIVVIDSATRRGASGLADSAYNDRRAECEAAARRLGLDSLRDLTWELFETVGDQLPDTLWRRARHVLTENGRVLEGAAAMRGNDPAQLGEILAAGHASQRDDFETSRPEIDALVELANAHPACYGARLTGGGFGGCVVSLVRTGQVQEFRLDLGGQYLDRTGLAAVFYATDAAAGAGILEP